MFNVYYVDCYYILKNKKYNNLANSNAIRNFMLKNNIRVVGASRNGLIIDKKLYNFKEDINSSSADFEVYKYKASDLTHNYKNDEHKICKIISRNIDDIESIILLKLCKHCIINKDSTESRIFNVAFPNIDLKKKTLEYLMKLDLVLYIECIGDVKFHMKHAIPQVILGAIKYNNIYSKESLNVHFYGDNSIVTVVDSGLDTSHCIFYDPNNNVDMNYISKSNYKSVADKIKNNPHKRVLSYTALKYTHRSNADADFLDSVGGHGTFTSSSAIFGSLDDVNCAATKDSKYISKARLLFIDIHNETSTSEGFQLPNSILWLLEFSKLSQSSLSSFSFGYKSSNYSLIDYEIDLFISLNPEYTVVVSAGNDGPESYTIGSPALAKNVITIGASSNTYESFVENSNRFIYKNYSFSLNHIKQNENLYQWNNIPAFTSVGPTRDGRIKPDILAPGAYILSARSKGNPGKLHSDTMLMQGTSMSTPIVANIIIFIMDILQKIYKVAQPLNALKKAILINFSDPVYSIVQESYIYIDKKIAYKNAYINTNRDTYGHGILNLDYFVQGNFDFIQDNITSVSKVYDKCYEIINNIDNFKTTLVYDDPPALFGSNQILVNNLNLQITVFKSNGNILISYGNDVPEGDAKNNVEKIYINLEHGDRIKISVGSLGEIFSLLWPYNIQKFVLVMNHKLKSIDCPLECLMTDILEQCYTKNMKLGARECISGEKSDTCILNGTSRYVEHKNYSFYDTQLNSVNNIHGNKRILQRQALSTFYILSCILIFIFCNIYVYMIYNY